MKYLVLLLVLAVAYMVWRSNRVARKAQPPANPAKPPASGPQDMVACPVCAVHLPRADAVAGADGRLFCSQEHRLSGGD